MKRNLKAVKKEKNKHRGRDCYCERCRRGRMFNALRQADSIKSDIDDVDGIDVPLTLDARHFLQKFDRRVKKAVKKEQNI